MREETRLTRAERYWRVHELGVTLRAMAPGEEMALPVWVDENAVYRALGGSLVHCIDVRHGTTDDGRMIVKRYEGFKPTKRSKGHRVERMKALVTSIDVGASRVLRCPRYPNELDAIARRAGRTVTAEPHPEHGGCWVVTRVS
jgi:hypothetical protein